MKSYSLFDACANLVFSGRFRHRHKILALSSFSTLAWLVFVCVIFDADDAVKSTYPCQTLPYEDPNCRNYVSDAKSRLIHTTSAQRFHLLKPETGGLSFITPVPKSTDKIILRWTKFYGRKWEIPQGQRLFTDLSCPQRECFITDDKSLLSRSDLVVIHVRDLHSKSDLPQVRRSAQRWMFLSLESPFHQFSNTSVISDLSEFKGLFNWTSTYSSDSDFPVPYGAYKHQNAYQRERPEVNYAEGKTRQVVWFVTNCKSKNNREGYARHLAKHIQVDIFGLCGPHKCEDELMCNRMIRHKYKFYLAFENSNCNEYITEKLWRNALSNNAIPVVMGAPRSHYERLAPPHSFVHVDDFSSPKELAKYLDELDRNDRLYNKYFEWKSHGVAEWYINKEPTHSPMWCDLCKALQSSSIHETKSHTSLHKWWSIEKQCPNNKYHRVKL